MTDPSLSQRSLPPAGWYRDPAQTGRERWWDGVSWSNQVRLHNASAFAPHGGPSAAPTTGSSLHPQARLRDGQQHGGFRPIARPTVAPIPAPVAQATTATASFWRRLVATVVDNLLVSFAVTSALPFFVTDFENRVLAGMQAFYADFLSGGQNGFSGDLAHLLVIVTYAVMAVTVLYGLVSLGVWSRTLGQRIVGIAVCPVDKPTEKVGWSRGLARSLAWTLLSQAGGVFLIANAFSVSMALWHPKRQTLPDLLARTQVVRRG